MTVLIKVKSQATLVVFKTHDCHRCF